MKRMLVRTFGILLPIALAATAFAGSAADAKSACGTGKFTAVTTKATQAKPVSVSVATQPGLGTTNPSGPGGDIGQVTHAYTSVVVQGPKSAKLFIRAEFQPFEDYDLYLRTAPDQPSFAYAAGFNPAGPANDVINSSPAGPISKGGHSEMGAEQIDGAPVSGCTTYVVDLASATTPGGAVTVKYWLK